MRNICGRILRDTIDLKSRIQNTESRIQGKNSQPIPVFLLMR